MWVGVMTMLLGSLIVLEVGRRSWAGNLARNRWVGIRLPSTMHDDDAWAAAHRAAGPSMLLTGALATGISIAAIVAAAGGNEGTAAVFVLIAAGVLVAGAVFGCALGSRAARRDAPLDSPAA